MSDAKLRRYRIEFDDAVAGWSQRFGVTAIDLDDALGLISRLSGAAFPRPTAVIEDVDVRTLDEGHVLPDMDPPNRRGFWFPMGVSQGHLTNR